MGAGIPLRHLCVVVSWAECSIHGGKSMSEQLELLPSDGESNPTAAQKLRTIRACIRLAKVRPQFIIMSKATAKELSNAGGLKPLLKGDDDDPQVIGYRIDDHGPIIIEDERILSFLLVSEVPLRQAGLSALPESAIIKPRF